MKIPLLDLKLQYDSIKDEIGAALGRVLDAQRFVLGQEVENLECEIARYCGASYGVGVASGTDALILSLKALGIKENDEVITTPLSFIATAEAVSSVGAIPVFVDIDKRTYNINPSLIEGKITKKTRAIMPVHIYGQCADMDPVLEVAKRHNLCVIEDCAQAIGASYKDKKAGTMGHAGGVSFFPSKNLGAFGDGGMVVTNNKEIRDKINILRVHGSSERYRHEILGHNSRLDNLQAAVLTVKLKSLDKWINMRRELALLYEELLSGTPVVTPFVRERNTHTYHLYVIAAPQRDELLKHLRASGIETRVYYPIPIHLQECYSYLGYKKGDFPIAEWASESTLAIPIYPGLKKEWAQMVADRIKEFFAR